MKCLKYNPNECFEALFSAVTTTSSGFEQKCLKNVLTALHAKEASFKTWTILISKYGLRLPLSNEIQKSSTDYELSDYRTQHGFPGVFPISKTNTYLEMLMKSG